MSAPLSADNEEKDIPTWPHAITNTSDVRNRYHFNLLSPEGLKHIIALAKEVSFKDDRMRLLEAALTERHVTAAQCVRLMELANFDDERLEIVRCGFPVLTRRVSLTKGKKLWLAWKAWLHE